jgi:hypothetical protein
VITSGAAMGSRLVSVETPRNTTTAKKFTVDSRRGAQDSVQPGFR